MINQTKNMMIGLFVIAACAIITFIILFLHPSVGDEGHVLRVRFANIDKINIGTRVTFAGRPVGEVVEITEIPAAVSEREGKEGLVYVYELKLVVDSKVNVFNTDTIYTSTSGLLGEKSVEITPHALAPGQLLLLVNDEILYAEESASMEETLKGFTDVANKVDQVLNTVANTLEELNEQQIVKKIGRSFDHLNLLLTRFNSKWRAIESTIDHIAATSANLDLLSAKMNQGEGSIGKMMATDDLYLRTTSIISKAETLMDDINHYGILFHLDKGWQRLRARRMNLLQKLSTPQQFRNFFNDEINQITTSLSRVSMLLEKTYGYPAEVCLTQDIEFSKVFFELLRRVASLEEALKMYNQQLVDSATKQTELCAENQ